MPPPSPPAQRDPARTSDLRAARARLGAAPRPREPLRHGPPPRTQAGTAAFQGHFPHTPSW